MKEIWKDIIGFERLYQFNIARQTIADIKFKKIWGCING